MNGGLSPDGHFLLASVTDDRVTFALASPSGDIDDRSIQSFDAAQQSTFTGAIQHYAVQTQLLLSNRQMVLAVAGAIRGDAVRVTNGRWFISLSGLRAMLGRDPIVLNDVTAVAWATLMLGPSDRLPLDASSASHNCARGRRAVIWVGEGLGAACLGHDAKGRPFALDGEAGHMTCAIEVEEERAPLDNIRPRFGHLSYERALHALASESGGSERRAVAAADRRALQLGLLASFVGSVALAYGAWDGIYLAGPEVPRLFDSRSAVEFRTRFAAKGRFRTMLTKVPIWIVERRNLALLGAAAFIRAEAMRGEVDRHPTAAQACT